MPSLIVILLLGMPRLALFLVWLFTDWIEQAFRTHLWPFLGFLFLPYTTIAYLWASLETSRQINGGWILIVALGLVCDLGFHGSSARRRRHDAE
jgi:hypothetical protein